MIDIYKSMVCPILEYGSVLIDNYCSTNDSLKLQQCQHTAALICTGAMRRTESHGLLGLGVSTRETQTYEMVNVLYDCA